MKKTLGHRIFRGMEANIIAQGAAAAVLFFATPVLVKGLGTASYGLYILMWTTQEYLLLSTLGMLDAVKKFSAEYFGTGAHARLGALMRAALAAQIAAGLSALVVGYLGREWLAYHVAEAASTLLGEAVWLFGCVAAGSPGYFVYLFAASVLYGQQRMRVFNAVVALHGLSTTAVAAVLVLRGCGLREIGVAYVLVQSGYALLSCWLARDILLHPGRLQGADAKAFLHFSLHSWLGQLARTFAAQGDRMLVGKLLAMSELGYYSLAASLAQKFNALCSSMTVTAFPIFNELQGTGQFDRMRRFYLKTNELALFLLAPATVLTFVLAPQFFTLWLGAEFSDYATWPLRLMVLANFASMATLLPIQLAACRGKPQWTAALHAMRAVLLLAAWTILIPRKGMLGAGWAFLIVDWFLSPIFIGLCNRHFLGLGWWDMAAACRRPLTAGLVLAVAAISLHARVATWAGFLAFGGAATAFYCALSFYLLEAASRHQFLDWLKSKLRRPA